MDRGGVLRGGRGSPEENVSVLWPSCVCLCSMDPHVDQRRYLPQTAQARSMYSSSTMFVGQHQTPPTRPSPTERILTPTGLPRMLTPTSALTTITCPPCESCHRPDLPQMKRKSSWALAGGACSTPGSPSRQSIVIPLPCATAGPSKRLTCG